MSRDVGFWDYGELQTVPYVLGLMHTTGFPTEILSGWLFAHALLLGSVAFRITLLCALCGIGAAVCAYAITLELGARPAIAVVAAIAYALMRLAWGHAASADVIDEAVFLSAAALLCALIARRTGTLTHCSIAATLGGLALGTHAVVIFYLPAAAAVLVMAYKKNWRAMLLSGTIMLAVASAVYAYLPIRSCQVERQLLDPTRRLGLSPGMPIWDWGAPCKASNFVAVLTGRQAGAPQAFHGYLALTHYPHYAVFALQQFGSPAEGAALIAAALLAFFAQRRPTRTLSWILFIPLVLVTPFASAFTTESDAARYYIFPALCLWAQVALGITALGRQLQTIAVAALVLLAVAFLWQSRGLFEQRNDRLGSTYIAAVKAATSDDGIVIAPWVDATPLAYAAYAERSFGRRFIVFGDAAAFAQQTHRWSRAQPVYEIGERPSVNNAQFVARLHLAPDLGRDTKVFRLRY
ncbi:MAG: DUF2723 domain-containing protein [Candidatus Eremiobacteraeota bacterium]|nr:DUF2723 domain-containing protein [Candidatus Eremiobacteraeota bacterium]MBV9262766.1 DUF2723 domain-containing protein [Candidatus Eremiobacteraeota bacterium]